MLAPEPMRINAFAENASLALTPSRLLRDCGEIQFLMKPKKSRNHPFFGFIEKASPVPGRK